MNQFLEDTIGSRIDLSRRFLAAKPESHFGQRKRMTESYSSRTINEEELRKKCQMSVLINMFLLSQPFESMYLLPKMVIFQLAMVV